MGVHVGLVKPEIVAMLLVLCTFVHKIHTQNGHNEWFLLVLVFLVATSQFSSLVVVTKSSISMCNPASRVDHVCSCHKIA